MDVIHQHFGYIRRSKGHSAVAASAYRAGEKLYSKYDGKIYDFTKKRGIVFSQIFLPVNAPLSFHNREILWNSVEAVERNSNSQLAKEFVSEDMCSDIAIHDKNDGNPHAHVMLTLR